MTMLLLCGKCKKKVAYHIENGLAICGDCKAKNRICNCNTESKDIYDGFYSSMIKSDKDFTISEWLNFNFLTYIEMINSFISQYEFDELHALTAEDLAMGKLSDVKIDKLKKVLRNGVNNNYSINKIAENIEGDVKPGAVYRIDKDGKRVVRLNQTIRSGAIARTEITRCSNGGALMHYKDAGVKRVKWVASYSQRTCEICADLNSQIFNLGEEPPCPNHVLCRCCIIPVSE